jgi:hypothetical protein
MEFENILRDWLLGLIAALLAMLVLVTLADTDYATLDFAQVLAPIANVLAVVTFLAFVLITGAFLVYAASFRD